jgi:chaperonin GroES
MAKSKLSIQPLADRVVVKPASRDEKTASGIIIPDSGKERAERGTVVAVGPGKWNEDGDERIPVSVNVGDTVLFSTYEDARDIDGEDYYIIPESAVLAIIN